MHLQMVVEPVIVHQREPLHSYSSFFVHKHIILQAPERIETLASMHVHGWLILQCVKSICIWFVYKVCVLCSYVCIVCFT